MIFLIIAFISMLALGVFIYISRNLQHKRESRRERRQERRDEMMRRLLNKSGKEHES